MAKARKRTGGAECPICHTFYRVARMAQKCARTPLCRTANRATGLRARGWEQMTLVAALVDQLHFLERKDGGCVDELERALADQLAQALEACRGKLQEHCVAATDRYIRADADRIMDAARKAFGVRSVKDLASMPVEAKTTGAAYLRLVREVIDRYEHAWAVGREWASSTTGVTMPKDGLPDALEEWTVLESTLSQLVELWDADEDWTGPDEETLYRGMRGVVFGSEPERRDPALFELSDGTLVVARGREELRACVSAELGWRPTGAQIFGISPGEVFGDGRTAREVVDKWAASCPCIVGRTG